MKGLNGNTKEQHDLIVNIDLVYMTVTIKTLELPVQDIWCLSKDLVADLKEVFMLFDKDEDGVLTFSELDVVMKCLGQRTSGNFHQYNLFLNDYFRKGTSANGERCERGQDVRHH